MKKLTIILILLLVLDLVFAGYYWTLKLNNIPVETMHASSLQLQPKPPPEPRPFTLMFVGDIMLSRGVGNKMKKQDNYKYPFLKIADYLQEADLLFGNLEGPISDKGADRGKKYSFRASPKAIEGLKYAGFDILSIANNHILDWGQAAKQDTILRLKNNNILPVGFDEKPVLEIENAKISFLAYTYPLPNKIEMPEADIKIISMHSGTEYEKHSNLEQQKFARAAIDAGADLVIGHHPHVTQEIEKYKNKFIFYSLGNFVFDQTWSQETMQGWLAKIVIKDKRIISAEPINIKISKDFQPFLSVLYPVGKKNSLGLYHPDDLIEIALDKYIRKIVYNDLMALLADAPNIKIISGFRSFSDQKKLFDQGNPYYTAEPGHSEHQLGTTIDFGTGNPRVDLKTAFIQTKTGKWLEQNAWKYGFVMSYPQENNQYAFEPWHYRFIGREQAQQFKKSGLFLIEYLE